MCGKVCKRVESEGCLSQMIITVVIVQAKWVPDPHYKFILPMNFYFSVKHENFRELIICGLFSKTFNSVSFFTMGLILYPLWPFLKRGSLTLCCECGLWSRQVGMETHGHCLYKLFKFLSLDFYILQNGNNNAYLMGKRRTFSRVEYKTKSS